MVCGRGSLVMKMGVSVVWLSGEKQEASTCLRGTAYVLKLLLLEFKVFVFLCLRYISYGIPRKIIVIYDFES